MEQDTFVKMASVQNAISEVKMLLCISIELLLLVLILVYMVLAIILGLVRGWKYLKEYPDEKTGKEYHWHNERITLTLAGFSLTAFSPNKDL